MQRLSGLCSPPSDVDAVESDHLAGHVPLAAAVPGLVSSPEMTAAGRDAAERAARTGSTVTVLIASVD